MWKEKRKGPVVEFLGWVLFLALLVQSILLLLEPCSITYVETGKITVGYVIYAILGMFFDTPCPFVALFITLRRTQKITVKEYLKRVFCVPKPKATIFVTGFFCVAALIFALVCGEANGSPWYMMPLGFLVMIPFVGIAEEPGWRGFLQPEMEKRFPFPIATSFTAVIWGIWHLPLWLMPTSNHYNDSMIGFAITIFVWSFVGAAIYKATKSPIACGIYHAFINSTGAIYDWNTLFDSYPKNGKMMLYYGIIFVAAITIWVFADRKEKVRKEETKE